MSRFWDMGFTKPPKHPDTPKPSNPEAKANPKQRKGTRSRVPKRSPRKMLPHLPPKPEGPDFSRAVKATPKALPLCRRPERSPQGERLNIAFVFALAFISPRFPPKKRMSSPQNPPTLTKPNNQAPFTHHRDWQKPHPNRVS
jgi:hypothetical protein